MRAKEMLAVVHQLADDHGEAALVLDRDGLPERSSSQGLTLLQRFFGVGDPRRLPEEVRTWLTSQPDAAAPTLVRRHGTDSIVVRHVHDGQRDNLFLFVKENGLPPSSPSARIVDKHIATILDKIGARTRLEAVSLLSQHGWQTGPPEEFS